MALKDFKVLSKDALIYGIGNAADRMIQIVLLPLFAAYLSIDKYGIRSLTIPAYEFLKIIILLCIDQAVIADYFKVKTEAEQRNVISTGFTFSVVTSIAVGVLGYFFAGPFVKAIKFVAPESVLILKFFSIFTAFSCPSFVFLSFLRCERKPWAYMFFTIIKAIVKVGLIVFFLAFLKKDLLGIYVVDAILAVLTFFPVSVWIYVYSKGIKFSFRSLKSMFLYSLPLVPNMAFYWMRTMLDRWIILPMLGKGAVGVFGFAIAISSVVSFLLLATVNLAWTPYAFSIKDKPDLHRITSRLLTYVLFLVGWALIVLGGGANELLHVITKKPEYWSAAPLVPILLVAMGFMGVFNIVGTPCQIARKTIYFTITSIAGAIIVVAMNIFLIPLMGLYASALAWVLSYAVMTVMMLFFSRKFMEVSYEKKRIVLVSLSSILLTAGFFFLKIEAIPHWATLFIKCLGGSALYLLFLLISGFLLPSEREYIKRKLDKKKRN